LKSIQEYVQRYGARMSPSNLKKLEDLISILLEFTKYFEKMEGELNEKKKFV